MANDGTAELLLLQQQLEKRDADLDATIYRLRRARAASRRSSAGTVPWCTPSFLVDAGVVDAVTAALLDGPLPERLAAAHGRETESTAGLELAFLIELGACSSREGIVATLKAGGVVERIADALVPALAKLSLRPVASRGPARLAGARAALQATSARTRGRRPVHRGRGADANHRAACSPLRERRADAATTPPCATSRPRRGQRVAALEAAALGRGALVSSRGAPHYGADMIGCPAPTAGRTCTLVSRVDQCVDTCK